MENKKGHVHVNVDVLVDRSELDDALQKAQRLHDLLQEAKSLAADLASMHIGVTSELEIER